MESRNTPVHILFSLVLAFTIISTEVSATENKTNKNNDGNITWADFPPGEEYLTPDEYDEGDAPLPAVWDMMYGWINTISPGQLPYAEIGALFNDGFSDIGAVQALLMENLTSVFMGFAVCIAIGFLFLLIFPIVCCCFCCCRMCGNCGGKMHQKETSTMKCKKITFLVLLLATTCVLGFGVACGYFVNERTGDVLSNLEDNVVNTIDDMLKYINNTVEELTFVAIDQTVWLIGQVLGDFSNVGGVLGKAIYDSAAVTIDPAVDAMIAVVTNIRDSRDTLEDLNTRSTKLKSDYDTFCVDLENLKTSLSNMYAGCGAGCPGAGRPSGNTLMCRSPKPKYDTTENGETYPILQTNATIIALNNILDTDPDPIAEAEAGRAQFESIPEQVQNASEAAISSINDTFSPFLDEIDDAIDPLTRQLSEMTGGVEGIKDGISGVSDLLSTYDIYRWYAMNGLHGVVLLVVVFNIIGILFGLLGCRSNASPTDRSRLSNCGGLFLMASAGFCFIFACLYMFLTVLPFMIGAPINKFICQPLLSGELLEATIDNPEGFMGSDGYYLGDKLFNDGDIKFTMSGALDECENDGTPYNAFHLQSFFDISKYTNFDQYFDDTQFGDLTNDIDLSSIEIMSSATEDSLSEFKNVDMDKIDWVPYQDELALGIMHNDYGDSIVTLADQIDQYVIDNSVPAPYDQNLRDKATDVRNFQTTNVQPIVDQRETIKSLITNFQTNAANVNDTVDNAIAKGNEADDYFASGNISDVINDEVDKYKLRVKNYLAQFSEYVNKSIDEDIGKCKPVANVIDNIFNLLCRSFLDPFNGFWFINGLYVFFFMPSIIFGVKLAKFFRRMKTADSHSDSMEMKSYPDYGQGAPFNNKVAAGPV